MAHGSSPAAWTSVTLALIGFTIGGIGLIPSPNWVVFGIGAVLAVAAAPIALVMSAVGYGGDQGEAH